MLFLHDPRLVKGRDRESGSTGEVSEIEIQTRSSSINPQRQTETRLARHIKTSLSNTSAHELQITPGQRWRSPGTVNVSGDTDKNVLTLCKGPCASLVVF